MEDGREREGRDGFGSLHDGVQIREELIRGQVAVSVDHSRAPKYTFLIYHDLSLSKS